MVVQAPTLSTVMLPTAMSAVPNLFIEPGSEAYAKAIAADAFANAEDEGGSLLSPDPVDTLTRHARIISSESQVPDEDRSRYFSEIPSVIQLPTQQQRLRELFDTAREARTSHRIAEAKVAYDEALKTLEMIHDVGFGDAPLHEQLAGGYHLYTEALFQTSILSMPEEAPVVISRLIGFTNSPPLADSTPTADVARAKLLTAFNLEQHTGSTFDRQDVLFNKALKQLDCLMEAVKKEAPEKFRKAAIKAHELIGESIKKRGLRAKVERKAMNKVEKAVNEMDSVNLERSESEHDSSIKTNYLSDFKTIKTLFYQARAAAAPQRSLYEKAIELVDEASNSLNVENSAEEADLDLYARFLGIELVSRRLALAVGSRAVETQKALVKDLRERFQEVTHIHSIDDGQAHHGNRPESRHTVEEKNRLIAAYQADVAILMAHLGMWNDALFRARSLTSGPFARTPAAKKLLRSEIFSPFVDGYRILAQERIEELSKKGSWRKEFQAIVANAHSRSMLYTLGAGAVGAGLGAAWGIFVADVPPVFSGMAGAFLGSLAYRIAEATRSEDYKYRELTERLDRSLSGVAADTGRLLLHSAMDMLPWIMPAYMLDPEWHGPSLLRDVYASSWDGIVNGFNWSVDHVAPAFNPDTYTTAINSLGNMPMPSFETIVDKGLELYGYSALGVGAASIMWREALQWTKRWGPLLLPGLISMLVNHSVPPEAWAASMNSLADGSIIPLMKTLWQYKHNFGSELHDIATAGALVTFVATFPHFRSKEQKQHIKNVSAYLLPAAIYLSADIGHALAPTADSYGWRLIRGLILTVESYFLMNVTGMVNWERKSRRNWRQNTENFIRANMEANPALALTMVMTNAITAPLGGYIERDKELMHPMLIALQGIAITTCLLPITLLASGLIKRKIPYLERAMEGWDDARHAGYGRARATGAAVMGFGSALNTPYISNRFKRPFMWDPIPAGLRTWLGWDTAAGQMAMSGTNILSGNSISTKMWPEPGGTKWEREAIVKKFGDARAEIDKKNRQVLEGVLTSDKAAYAIRDIMSGLRHYFLRAGRVIDEKHIMMPQESIRDRLLPFYSIKMAIQPPSFPQKPNPHFYANLFKMLYSDRSKERPGTEDENLSDDDVRLLLSYAKIEAMDPSAHNVVLPLIKTLALARHSKDATIRHEINKFFDDNPEIPVMLGIDIEGEALQPLDEVYRRVAKRKVRGEIKSSISDEVSGYRRQKKANVQLRNAFVTDIDTASTFISPPPTPTSPNEKSTPKSEPAKSELLQK